jgi:acetyl esterase/lipase
MMLITTKKKSFRLEPIMLILLTLGIIPSLFSQFSANTKAIKRKWVNLPYANVSASQKLDIYLPNEGNGPFPIIMAIHGGAFILGDKADMQLNPMLKGLQRGYAIVSINYRLSNEAKFPKNVQDVKAAIRWIRTYGNQYMLKTDKIAVWGGSAGGYLAAMAGVSANIMDLNDSSLGNPQQSDRVQAVVDWFGPVNFLTMDQQLKASGNGIPNHSESNSPESKLLGQKITEIPDRVKIANPETYISSDDPPFLIEHGSKDPLVPTQQSEIFAAKLIAANGDQKTILHILQGAHHGSSEFSSPENLQLVFDFLDKYLK